MVKEASVNHYGCLNLLLFSIYVDSALVHAVTSTSVQLQNGCCWPDRRKRGEKKENKNVRNGFVKPKHPENEFRGDGRGGEAIKATIFSLFILPVFTH